MLLKTFAKIIIQIINKKMNINDLTTQRVIICESERCILVVGAGLSYKI